MSWTQKTDIIRDRKVILQYIKCWTEKKTL